MDPLSPVHAVLTAAGIVGDFIVIFHHVLHAMELLEEDVPHVVVWFIGHEPRLQHLAVAARAMIYTDLLEVAQCIMANHAEAGNHH